MLFPSTRPTSAEACSAAMPVSIGNGHSAESSGLRSTTAGPTSTRRNAPPLIYPAIRPAISTRTLTARLDSLASARARFGYLLSPDVLLYGTGGAAWAHTRLTDTITFHDVNDNTNLVVTSRASANPFGWVAGAGA